VRVEKQKINIKYIAPFSDFEKYLQTSITKFKLKHKSKNKIKISVNKIKIYRLFFQKSKVKNAN
jgi:hypothetical protein